MARFGIASLLVGTVLLVPIGQAQQIGPAPVPIVAAPIGPAPPTYDFDCLAKMSWMELEDVYRHVRGGTLPCGYFKGRAIYCKARLLPKARTAFSRVTWKGKHFCGNEIENQLCGIKGIRGKVCYGQSWLDGEPSIILDYRNTSHVWKNVRDEMRQVGPDLYLGIMYVEKKCDRKIRTFFVIKADPCSKHAK